MNTKLVAVIVIIIIVIVAGISLYYVSTKLSSTVDSSSTSLAVGNVTSVEIVSDNLTVGYQSGLWEVTLKNTGNTAVSMIFITLKTPISSYMCTSEIGASSLSFSLCSPGSSPGNPLPPGLTIFGSASGSGEGSATIGSSYPVDARVTYANGVVDWVNSTVTAQAPS